MTLLEDGDAASRLCSHQQTNLSFTFHEEFADVAAWHSQQSTRRPLAGEERLRQKSPPNGPAVRSRSPSRVGSNGHTQSLYRSSTCSDRCDNWKVVITGQCVAHCLALASSLGTSNEATAAPQSLHLWPRTSRGLMAPSAIFWSIVDGHRPLHRLRLQGRGSSLRLDFSRRRSQSAPRHR